MRRAFVLAISLALVLSSVPEARSQIPAMSRIGVAAGVHGLVQAFSGSAENESRPVGRILSSGQALYIHEKLTTGPDGGMQVMLLDETTFSIGPNSSMVLDEFVYDPKKGGGKVTATVLRGVYRFVTGQIGHNRPSDMKVKFPIGTMGIRGTMVAGEVSPTGTTAVLLGPGPANNAPGERVGAFSLENAGKRVDVVKPGYGTHIEGPDGIPSIPAVIPIAQLQALLETFSSLPAPGSKQIQVPEPGDHSSASSDADQDTAGASGDLAATENVAAVVGDAGLSGQTATNDIDQASLDNLLLNNQDLWESVSAITSGTGYYLGSGSFNLTACNAGACAAPSGTMNFRLDIDFGAQTVGSAASGISISANDATIGTINDNVPFAQQSYAGLSGPAILSGVSASGNLTGQVSLLNVSGIASHAAASAAYSNAAGTAGAGNLLVPLTCTSGTCKP